MLPFSPYSPPCRLLYCAPLPCSGMTFCAVCALLSTFCHFICSVKYFGPLPKCFSPLLLPSSFVLFLLLLVLSCVVADAFATFAFAIRICRCSWGQLVIKRENISLIIVRATTRMCPEWQRKRRVKAAQEDSQSGPARFASKWRHFHLVVLVLLVVVLLFCL